MKRTLVVILVVLALCAGVSPASGQELQDAGYKHHAIYAELLGQGILYSINYDYLITDNLSLRAGFSSWSIPAIFFIDGDLSFTGYPVLVNYLVGNGDSRLEIGAGILPAKLSLTGHDVFFGAELSGDTTIVMGTGSFAYRYQQRDGGLLFRIGLTPFLYSGNARLSGQISIGFGF